MKKIIALLLAMSMCFALVACGNTQKPAGDTNKPGVENTDPTPAPQPDENQPTDTPDVSTDKPDEGTDSEGDKVTDATMAGVLLEDFKAKVGTMTTEELANELLTNEVIQFTGATAPVEAGYLNGFDNEISG